MNNYEILKSIASKLYVEAVNTCFFTTVIAVAALQGIKLKQNQNDDVYISIDHLKDLGGESAYKA